MKRFAHVTRLVPEKADEYRTLHASVWPSVLATISACNISNYSIFEHDGWLFSYFEYHGDDIEADMDKMAQDPDTQRWWALTDPCQQRPVEDGVTGPWLDIDEIFHHD